MGTNEPTTAERDEARAALAKAFRAEEGCIRGPDGCSVTFYHLRDVRFYSDGRWNSREDVLPLADGVIMFRQGTREADLDYYTQGGRTVTLRGEEWASLGRPLAGERRPARPPGY